MALHAEVLAPERLLRLVPQARPVSAVRAAPASPLEAAAVLYGSAKLMDGIRLWAPKGADARPGV